MAARVVVLGGGMVGSAMACDLSLDRGLEVTVVDVSPVATRRLGERYGLRTRTADLSNPETVRAIAAEHDFVVGALPSVIGLQSLKAVIEAGRGAVDISFMPEDARVLDGLARERGVTLVYDCGIAPGLGSMMLAAGASRLDECERAEIACGGLPVERLWPYQYKAGFAPSDVIEVYTRPVAVVEDGRVATREPMSGLELVDFPGLGTLESFLTDGLRSLVDTVRARRMEERTLRYPGHIELMKAFWHAGLFSKEPVAVGGAQVRPVDVTAAVLFPKWAYAEGEADLTVMRVVTEGRRGGERVRLVWELFDRYDPETGLRSMPRTTAFPATATARRLLSGAFTAPGVHPPEALGPRFLDGILDELRARGIQVSTREERLAAD